MLISQGSDEMELLVVQILVGKHKIRVLNGYGPQENDIKATQVKCAGPNGEILKTHGEIYKDFQLGSRTYNAKFIVVQLEKRTAGIIGYNFMKQNNISIYCGRALTNDDNHVPDDEESITE